VDKKAMSVFGIERSVQYRLGGGEERWPVLQNKGPTHNNNTKHIEDLVRAVDEQLGTHTSTNKIA
jgi:hypothetical protein